MSSVKIEIQKVLLDALKTIGSKTKYIAIDYPDNSDFGSFASPIALNLAKELKQSPKVIAEEIYQKIKDNEMFESIEIAGLGYLNFFLSDEYLQSKLMLILTSPSYGANRSLFKQHILLEYISANPTGPLHIGHGRWAAVGDSLARILSFSGASIFREFYVNDAGVQIAHLNNTINAVLNNKPIPEDGYQGFYIKELAEESQKTGIAPEILMQESQKRTLKKFNTEFDRWFSEKTLHKDNIMEDTFKELEQKKAIYIKDGATWFCSTEYSNDDKDRVIIKSDRSFTYFASDIAYHRNKIQRGFPILINILGFDHHGYVERISAAVKVLGGNLTVLLGQMVNLFRNGQLVRMSKRTGEMITLDEVIEEIGTDATRYLLLRRSMNSEVDFDLDIAKLKGDKNPVYYVQYAHARIAAILRNTKSQQNFQKFSHKEEKLLLLELIKFEDLILEIGHTYDIHKLPMYLEKLAGVFHKFYKNCRIIDDPNEQSRLALSVATKKILAQGLELLGISAPEKMESKNET